MSAAYKYNQYNKALSFLDMLEKKFQFKPLAPKIKGPNLWLIVWLQDLKRKNVALYQV